MAVGRTAKQVIDDIINKHGANMEGHVFKIYGASLGKTTPNLKASFFNISILWVGGPNKGRRVYWEDTPIDLIEMFIRNFNQS